MPTLELRNKTVAYTIIMLMCQGKVHNDECSVHFRLAALFPTFSLSTLCNSWISCLKWLIDSISRAAVTRHTRPRRACIAPWTHSFNYEYNSSNGWMWYLIMYIFETMYLISYTGPTLKHRRPFAGCFYVLIQATVVVRLSKIYRKQPFHTFWLTSMNFLYATADFF